jgi:uncharacterized membrane protein YjgN (DUF898 family)
MNGFIIALIVLAALATAYVLVRGIITMASGKDVTGQQSNKYMWRRVQFQMLAVLLVIVLMLMMGRGPAG